MIPSKKIYCVTPVYNDWESFGILIDHLRQQQDEHSERFSIEIVAVNDGSGKERSDTAFGLPVTVLNLKTNVGHQRAIAVGLQYIYNEVAGEADYVLVLDSDGEDKPEDITALFEKAEAVNSTKIIFAQRNKRQESLLFKTGYFFYKHLFRFLTGQEINFGNFSIIPIKLLGKVVHQGNIWNHYSGGIIQSKIPFDKVLLDRGKRYKGISKMNTNSLIIHGLSSISVYFDQISIKILKLSLSGILICFVSVLYILGEKLFTNYAIPGWASSLILIISGIILQLFSVTLIVLLLQLSSRKNINPPNAKVYLDFIESTDKLKTKKDSVQKTIVNKTATHKTASPNRIHWNRLTEKQTYLVSFLIILTGFQVCYGLHVILPGNTDWLMSAYHDWGQHYLGWAYFRNEPWHFPLGHIDHFNYPAGTNVGYTDSIPLLALFFKSVSFLLPDTFQYLGMWLLACHLLTGYFTIKILRLYHTGTLYILLAVILMTLNPVLVFRGLHPALCGQWLILASLYYYLMPPTAQDVKSINKKQLVILVVSALVNPYLFLMVVGFNIILPIKHYFYDKTLSLKRTVFYIGGSMASVLLSWYLIGMIGFDRNVNMEIINSYGLYSLNLNSLYNAQGFSSFLPIFSLAREQQYEGYAYLGLGMILLLLISAGFYFWEVLILKKNRLKNRAFLPLLLLTTTTALFAITNKLTLNGATILEFPIPDIIMRIGGIFRACGRFIWVLYYLLIVFAIVFFVKIKLSDKIKIPVLATLVFLQVYDTKLLLTFRDLPGGKYEMKKMNERDWTEVSSKFKKIVTYPPFDNNLLRPLDYQDFCYVALKNNLPITTGYVARDTGDSNRIFSDSLGVSLSEGIMDDNSLYITPPKHLDAFIPLLYQKKATLRYLDGYYYLFSSKHKITLQKTKSETRKTDSVYAELKRANNIKSITKPSFLTGKIKVNIEQNSFNNDIVQVAGWAFLANQSDNAHDSIYIALTNNEKTYLVKANPIQRPDVTAAFKKANLANAGFRATIFTNGLENKKYSLAIAIRNKNNQWTFQKLDEVPAIDFRKRNPPKQISSLPPIKEKILYNVEKANCQAGNVFISGWAALEKENAANSQIKVVLINGKTMYEAETDKSKREDVTAYLKSSHNYDDSGFNLKVKTKDLKPGKYSVGLIVTTAKNTQSMIVSDKTVIIK